MSRILTYENTQITQLLEALINPGTGSEEYRNTMYLLGLEFGKILAPDTAGRNSVSLACTVEDADFLAKGIIEVLEQQNNKILLTVFWNKRFKPNKENGISVAPIIKEFHEPGYAEADVLVILKSVISSACVVRTNLTRLIEVSNPGKIFVVAPVLLHGSKEKISSEFKPEVANLFQYIYFAEDNERTEDGIVLPGIGGDVYKRLGFDGQQDKNKFIPSIVKERRYTHA